MQPNCAPIGNGQTDSYRATTAHGAHAHHAYCYKAIQPQTWVELCHAMSSMVKKPCLPVERYDDRMLEIYREFRTRGFHTPMSHDEAVHWTVYKIADKFAYKGRYSRTQTRRRGLVCTRRSKEIIRERLEALLAIPCLSDAA